MATIAFKAIGTAAFGPAGGLLGGLIGAYIDGSVLSKFGSSPKTKVGDIKIGTAEEGSPINMVMGPEVRSGCNIIWRSEERSHEQDSGGGGGCGGPSPPSTYTYTCDFAACIGQPPPGFVIESLTKVFFDGKVAWQGDPDITITSTVVTASIYYRVEGTATVVAATNATPIVVTLSNFLMQGTFRKLRIVGATGNTNANGLFLFSSGDDDPLTWTLLGTTGNGAYTGGGVATCVTQMLEIRSPNGGPDLSVFKAGYDVTVSGYTGGSAVNNGTFYVWESGRDPVTGESWVRVNNQAGVAAIAGFTVVLFQDLPQTNQRLFASLTFHDGSQWQLPDSLIEAVQGVGNVSGNPGLAYVVIEDYDMTAFGDRIANVNTLCKVSTSWTVGQSIAACLARGGLEPTDYDVSACTASCRGFNVEGPVTSASALAAILVAFNIIHYEIDDKLFFVPRKDIVPTVIATSELVAHLPGSAPPRRARVRQLPESQIPREVQIHYQNPNRDYQGGMETAKRSGSRGDNVEVIETNVTMSPGPAQDMGRRLLWTGFANRHSLEIMLAPSRVQIHEGMVLQFPEQGRTWNMLVKQLDFQYDGPIVAGGPNDEAAALDFSGSPANGGAEDTGGPGVLQALNLEIVDVAPLSDSHVSTPGVYAMASPVDQAHVWVGAELFESSQDTDGTFVSAVSLPRAARMGRASTILASATPFLIDYANTVDVLLTFGASLESTSEADMLGGKNRAILGGEMIGFTTATNVGTNTWRLSGLLRGLRDTDTLTGQHSVNERFLMLTPATGVTFVTESIGFLNSTRYYRATPVGGSVDDYPSVPELFDAATVRPFSVFDVQGYRLASDATPDVVVTCTRQTRSNVGPFTPAPVPLNESRELYEIDLMDKATGSIVVLTKQVTTPTVTFTDAEITANGYTSGDLIQVRWYQIGDLVGRGHVRAATV